jgi:iron complex outermembrane receptor protein
MCLGSCADSSFREALLCAQPDCEGGRVSGKGKRAVPVMHRVRIVARSCAIAAILAGSSLPAWSQQKSADLTQESLEDLMNVKVTSVSKTEQTLSRTAAAVFVISPEDISRSGALNIPDLLRMVPGVDVAQINANTWAVNVRGFNARFSNDLLVLLDGRPVYTQTFGGVYWDVLDLPLENIERIEVIRGPGGSIWGANAVNGVINIITQKASETPGGLVIAGGGNTDQGFGAAQYGGNVGDKMDYRVYAKYFNQDHFPDSAGQDGGDGWHELRVGFRMDSVVSSKDTLMFEGSIYSAREGLPTISFPSVTATSLQNIEQLGNLSGGFVQGVWNHTHSPHSDTTLQVSYDGYEREDILRENRGTLNFDFQHHFSGWARQNIVWGLTYRYSAWNSDGNLAASFDPPDLNTQIFSSFIQDEIAIIPDKLFLTVGTKLEDDHYTGFNLMPSARVAWAPTAHQTLWAAVSQADRTPSALDTSARSTLSGFPGPGGVPVLVTFIGNPHVKNEGLIAYEVGYRTTVLKQLSIDFTAYYNNYSDQDTSEPEAPFLVSTPAPPHFIQPITFENLMHGESNGVEIAVNWQPTRRWTLSPGYAFEEIHMHLAPASQDTTSVSEAEGSSPDHSAQLRSHLVLCHGLSWDTSAYFVGRLVDPSEPSYTRLDSQLSWHFSEGASLSFVGQNLLKDLHEEFVDASGTARTTQIKRSAYAKFTWRF